MAPTTANVVDHSANFCQTVGRNPREVAYFAAGAAGPYVHFEVSQADDVAERLFMKLSSVLRINAGVTFEFATAKLAVISLSEVSKLK